MSESSVAFRELVRIGKSAEEARMKIVLATTIVHIISSLLADHQLILYFRLPMIKTPPTRPI
jgi:hypothetical protein